MGVAKFPLPSDPDTITSLLNASRMWNLTISANNGRFYLVDGDQLMYTAESEAELQAFLAGCFLATFMGNSETDIRQQFETGRFHQDRDWDDIKAEVERERKDRHE
jgi:hypothetical protein